jgi:Tol biopolymer transport system component
VPRLRNIIWVLGLILVGCQSAPRATPQPSPTPREPQSVACPSAPGPINKEIIFVSGGNLVGLMPDGGEPLQLTTLPADITAHDPAWSPDGSTLLFRLQYTAAPPAPIWLPLGTLCALDRASGAGSVVLRGENPAQAAKARSYGEAAWTVDGQALIATVYDHEFSPTQDLISQGQMLSRYDLKTQELTPLIVDGRHPATAPDGKHLAYIALDQLSTATRLMVSELDGQNAHELKVPARASGEYRSPRWSPDGSQIAFGLSIEISGGVAPQAERSWLEELFTVPMASAHGIPADIWVIGSDGQGATQLTFQAYDDPRFAWSPQGDQLVYTSGFGGVTTFQLASKQERSIEALNPILRNACPQRTPKLITDQWEHIISLIDIKRSVQTYLAHQTDRALKVFWTIFTSELFARQPNVSKCRRGMHGKRAPQVRTLVLAKKSCPAAFYIVGCCSTCSRTRRNLRTRARSRCAPCSKVMISSSA